MLHRYGRVWTVFRKELLETLRDRRTLIAMVLVPIVLYPLLMVVLVEALRTEKVRRQAERYTVCVTGEHDRKWLQDVLNRAGDEHGVTPPTSKPATEGLNASLRGDRFDIHVIADGSRVWQQIRERKYHAAVLVSPSPASNSTDESLNRVVQIVYCDTDPRSEFVYHQLARIFEDESEHIVRHRVSGLPNGEATLTPLLPSSISTAGPQQQFAKTLATIVPFLLVVMSVTGAMYPAIDLTAGERERGTLETLAVSPVPTGQIVAGKFGVIVAIAMIGTALNLGSMTAMVHFSKLDKLASMMASRGPESPDVQRRIAAGKEAGDPAARLQWENLQQRRNLESGTQQQLVFFKKSAPIVLLAMLPFAVLAGGVMLAVCSFARTFKEAQTYMMPVMMAAILPAMVVSYMPSVKLEGLLLVIPVANVVVMIRELLLGNFPATGIAICLLSTAFYATVAVTIAAKLYANESVLFTDVGSYKTLFARRFLIPAKYPSAATALLTLAVIFPAYFYWQSYLLDPNSSTGQFKIILALSQILILALPVIAIAWYCKLDLISTFSLRLPSGKSTIGALMMAVAIVPVALLAKRLQDMLLPGLGGDDPMLRQQEALLTSGSTWTMIASFAILPAICEELLFRGYVLAGLREKLRPLALIVVVGTLFGFFHVIIAKIPVICLLGMVLAYVCVVTGSIWPGMFIHAANNALALACTRSETLQRLFGIDMATEQIAWNTRAMVFIALFLVGISLVRTRQNRFARVSAI